MKMPLTSTLIASAVALATLTGAAQAKGRLVVYCSATNEMCETETKEFGEKYDVKTSFIRNGSGSTLAKVDAEKKNPQADVWYGGTLDPQSQAGEMGLLQAYKSPNLEQIMEKFRDPAKVKGNLSSAVYVGILGFGVNTERLKEKTCLCRSAGKISPNLNIKAKFRLPIHKVPVPPTPRWLPLRSCGGRSGL